MTDSVRSYGGAAGEAAVLEDLERGARILNSAADLLDAAGRELSEARDHADVAARQGSESTRVAARSASAALWEAQFFGSATAPAAHAARDLSDRLSRVARLFLEAEQGAMAHVGAATRARLALGSAVGTGLWFARHSWAGAFMVASGPFMQSGAVRSVAGAIRPDGAPPTTGLLNKDTMQLIASGLDHSLAGYDLQVYALAAAMAALEGLFGEGHAIEVREREPSYGPRRPRGVGDLMAGIFDEEVRMDGSVSVETITHPDGTRSHIVTLPGTEDWLFDDNPVDGQANLPAVVGRASDAQAAIVAAMREAGIEPGEEVMLAGHSQGGINAVALTTNADFMEEFNVTHVVTAGSPVGRMAMPAGVKALHLEHTEDLVAGLDAVPNPDTASRTTVERDLSLSGDPQAQRLGRDIVGAHHLTTYGLTGDLVDKGEAGMSASIWKESAASFFSGEPSTLKEYVPVVPPTSGAPGGDSRQGAQGGAQGGGSGGRAAPPQSTAARISPALPQG
jgi:hypothetical protein